ncbi:hypothetical protein AAWM_11189 [Aspergillus awamori]|uniref:Uncharacterized protein n=1 Tax=Aspergillus awamori TaxID=105351 RepID=A0A401KZ32_ASPAW|nr:hypothetical protein AAWM_07357 [Aspergillus awamori]GCB28304.1 hypothetical protein AAWM_11189 [Aspergillus awamori]
MWAPAEGPNYDVSKEQQRLREAAKRREEEERQAREEAQWRVQPNSLFRLLDRCHNSLSRAIRVEADATLTTQGDAADPVNRLYPKHIVPWRDFPQLQEEVWGKFDRTAAFTSHPLFPFDTQIDYVVTNIQNRPIYSEASLRNLERDTVDNCIEKVINALRDDEPLRYDFGIQGRVTFYDRAKSSETSLDISLEQMDLEDARTPQRPANTRHRQKMIPPLSNIFSLAVEPPTQNWHDVAHDQLTTWKVEFLDVSKEIPETFRKDPPASNYWPSHWKPVRKIHYTRARCQPRAATPKHSSTEGGGSDQESHSPSAAAALRIRSSRGLGNHRQSTREGERTRAGRDHKQTSRQDGHST